MSRGRQGLPPKVTWKGGRASRRWLLIYCAVRLLLYTITIHQTSHIPLNRVTIWHNNKLCPAGREVWRSWGLGKFSYGERWLLDKEKIMELFNITHKIVLVGFFYHGFLPEGQSHGHEASCFIRWPFNFERLGENKQSCYWSRVVDWLMTEDERAWWLLIDDGWSLVFQYYYKRANDSTRLIQ